VGGLFTVLAVPAYTRLRARGEKADRVTGEDVEAAERPPGVAEPASVVTEASAGEPP
jgi:hypothetical protein